MIKQRKKVLAIAIFLTAFIPLSSISPWSHAQDVTTKTRLASKLDAATRNFILPPEQEKKIGDEMHTKIQTKYKLSTNQKLNSLIASVGSKLARHSGESTPIKFTTLDDAKTVNAFATPGGYVYITTGMINKLDNESQLAAVLGHEIGHITEDHVHARLRNKIGASLVAGFLGKLVNKDVSNSKFFQIGNYVFSQKFSRKHEYAADRAGAKIMAAAGYNPEGMVSLQDKLYQMSKGRLRIEFIESHPSSAKRRDEIAQFIKANNLNRPGMIVNTTRFKAIK